MFSDEIIYLFSGPASGLRGPPGEAAEGALPLNKEKPPRPVHSYSPRSRGAKAASAVGGKSGACENGDLLFSRAKTPLKAPHASLVQKMELSPQDAVAAFGAIGFIIAVQVLGLAVFMVVRRERAGDGRK